MTKESITRLITEEIAETLEISPSDISPEEEFMEMGLTSLEAIKLINTIRDNFNLPEISPTVIFEYHTIRMLSDYLEKQIVDISH